MSKPFRELLSIEIGGDVSDNIRIGKVAELDKMMLEFWMRKARRRKRS